MERRRLILDTGVLIAVERGRALREFLRPDDDVAIAAVTVAELRMGVELADAGRRARREGYVDGVLAILPTELYTLATARVHAELLAYVRRSGRPRGAHDLIIAATARTSGRTLVTTDSRARFEDLPGVRSLVVPGSG